MANVSNTPRTPFDALGKLMGTLGAEGGRALGELSHQAVADIDSIGRAVETGGFLGGLVQFMDKNSIGNHAVNLLDAATGPGSLPPQLREGVAAAVNYATGNPIFLKDLFDLATAPSQPGVRPSPPNGVPPPDVDQLRGGQPPRAPGDSGRTGYADSPAPPRSRQEITVVVNDTAVPLQDLLGALRQLRDDPRLKAEAPELYAVLHDDTATLEDVSLTVVADALRRNPEVLDTPEVRAVRDELEAAPSAPPTAATGDGDFSQFGQQAMGILGQVAGPLGMGMQLLGGLLGNPMVANFIAPLLVQGLNLLVPGLGVALAPILPVALPIVGQLLGAGGSMLAGGGAPGVGSAPGGQSPDALAGLLQTVVGAFAGGGAPALPIGAAGLAG
jgi:hypothetical protein